MSSTAPLPPTAEITPLPRSVVAVVPAPARVMGDPAQTYTLARDAAIQVTADPAATAVAEYLAGLLRPATGYRLPVTPADPATAADASADADTPAGGIRLRLDPAAGGGSESYRLDAVADGLTITAPAAAGLFYGVQTLRQLLPPAIEHRTPQPGPWVVAGVRIADAPRFGYRGAMLDVARHFFPVDDVLRFVDHIARYKLNHLHLHLTDDQGWRIAVGSWPRLGPVGGATQVGGGPGGHYTKDDYARIVEYAASRHITVVPEIDLPGHTHAALAAYGELAHDGVAPPPYTDTDVGFSAVDTASELTYAFVDDVLGEVAALTPGPYLHIGGDEAFTVPAADYAAFVDRVQRLVAKTGKTVVGWHQVASSVHAPGRVLQFWGTTPLDPVVADAVRRGARVILSPGDRAYLDMKYTAETRLGKDWAGPVDVRAAYDWNPGSYLVDVPEEAVLGIEAPLWTETITSLGDAEYMMFPRLPAIAELGWSPAAAYDWTTFRHRLAAQAPRWTAAGIAFHRSPEVPWPAPAVVPAPRRPDVVSTENPSEPPTPSVGR